MRDHKCCWMTVLGALLVGACALKAESISIVGGPADTGFDVGSVATIRAVLKGVSGDVARYVVFANIQYVGTTAVSSVQLDPQETNQGAGNAHFEGEWLIPSQAPTGIYSVTLRVVERSSRKTLLKQPVQGFATYRKLLRIARVNLDKTFYTVGEPIRCEVVLQNLTDHELKELRVEFSNANYPWIALYSAEATSAGKPAENPERGLTVLREHVNLPAGSEAVIPLMNAGVAAFLQGSQQAVMGAGAPPRHEKVPPPEVDTYTVAVWNAERTVLYDMQFSEPAIVRSEGQELPKPYGNNFTHPYNPDIDFTRYREFYPPGLISAAITVDHAHTLFRPGDDLTLKATLKNPGDVVWKDAEFRAEITDAKGKSLHAATLLSGLALVPGETRSVEAKAWTIPASLEPGVYSVGLSLVGSDGKPLAHARSEIAVNHLPASLLLFFAHEDDEQAYAGLIRAAVEAGIPIQVVIYTGGDVGACERYYSKPCGPNEAREFALVRMEESAEALEHLGLARDKLTILGLPDGGSGAIWFHHLKASNPFMSIYLATDHAPYANVLKPNLPYAREPVIELVKEIITDFRPAMIATTHPDERHVDHRIANWFTIKACQELLGDKRIDPKTTVLADQTYGPGGYKPAPYHYEKSTVFLSGEAAALKQEMSWIYQSQDGNLAEGKRRTFRELPREEHHLRVLDWQEHAGWNE
jgi:LmbE family N-acetylglucosaminyl deacetylase